MISVIFLSVMSHFKHSSITDLAKNVDKFMYDPAYIVNLVHHRALHVGLHVLREVCCILQNVLHDFLDWQDYCIDSGKNYYKNPTKFTHNYFKNDVDVDNDASNMMIRTCKDFIRCKMMISNKISCMIMTTFSCMMMIPCMTFVIFIC